MRAAALGVVLSLLFNVTSLAAQERMPTVAAARAAFAPPPSPEGPRSAEHAPASCGSTLKNGVLLGLGLALATAVIELTYTLVREPFVRNGSDLPGADPTIIVWAGGAGFLAGIVGTAICRRRR